MPRRIQPRKLFSPCTLVCIASASASYAAGSPQSITIFLNDILEGDTALIRLSAWFPNNIHNAVPEPQHNSILTNVLTPSTQLLRLYSTCSSATTCTPDSHSVGLAVSRCARLISPRATCMLLPHTS